MAPHSSSADFHDRDHGSATPWLAFALGVIVTAVVAMAVFLLASGGHRESRRIDIDLQAPTPSAPVTPPSPPKMPTPSTPTQ
ncbi:MAG: hypothetical protein JSR45_04765 [Proteobacteria bacterium]|nr:hypothetical protein [Pseudomonadota bacterium]